MKLRNQDGYFDAEYLLYGVIALIIVAFVATLIAVSVHLSTNHSQVSFKLNDKAVISTGQNGNGHQYMFYTTEGTFKDTDSVLNSKFNSSDLYGQLQVGKSYTCDAVGWRNGFFSEYKNLITCKQD